MKATCMFVVASLVMYWVDTVSAGPVLGGDPFIVVDLIPDNPGPYFGNERLTVDVWLQGENLPGDVLLKLVRFDFLQTDSTLMLDPTFTWDLSSLPGEPAYVVVPQLPLPLILNDLFCCPGDFLRLSTDAPLRIGSIGAILPMEVGTFTLDLLDSGFFPPALGAIIQTASPPPGFPSLEFFAFNRGIRGGRLNLVVIPDPASLVLLLMGVVLLGSRRLCRRAGKVHKELLHQ